VRKDPAHAEVFAEMLLSHASALAPHLVTLARRFRAVIVRGGR
jgi:hypothetical protein